MNSWIARFTQGGNSRMSMSFTNSKGLLNAPGENNCFLNSAVQVLWHLDVFRRSFRQLSGHACMGTSCIFCALKVIFTQFQYSDQTALPPDALRKALAKAFSDQQRFQLGHMDDAAECFENILMQIHHHITEGESEDMCSARHCISHRKFSMTIVEQIVCTCGATSEPNPYTQTVYYVSTSALVDHSRRLMESCRRGMGSRQDLFGQLLREAVSEGDMRPCPSDCGKKIRLRKNLTNLPDVLSVGLIWDSDHPSAEHIKEVVCSIRTTLKLNQLFHSVVDLQKVQTSPLQLEGVVCYYGKHYSTFFFHSKMKKWVYFDDATVKEIGKDWSNVVDKCCKGHFQPLLLLYANPMASIIPTETAMQKTYHVQTWPNKGQALNVNVQQTQGFPAYDPIPPRKKSISESDGLDEPDGVRYNHNKGSVSIGRRSMTPNPTLSCEPEYSVEPRRAVTPTPRHYIYDSEDEDSKRKGDYSHCRQASYLNAVEFEDPKHLHNGTKIHYEGKLQPVPTNNNHVSQYNVYNDSKNNVVTNGKQEDWPPPPSPNTLQATEIPTATNIKAGQNDVKHENWTLSGSSPYRRHNMPVQNGNNPRYTQDTANEGHSKANEVQRGESFKKGKDQIRSDVVRYQLEPASNGGVNDNVTKHTDNKSNMPDLVKAPGLKRTQSVEGRLNNGRAHDAVGQYGNTSQVSRTRSNTPFDYNNIKPQVSQRQGTVSNSINTQIDAKAALSNNKNSHDEYDDSTYISSKAVGSLLQYQQKLHRQISNNSAKSVTSVGSNESSDSDRYSDTKKKQLQKKDIQKKDKHIKDLKVEIPDNASENSQNSHQDSGYRSESSGGDRGSNSSSASNFSGDSPAVNGLMNGLPKPEQIKMLFGVQNWDGRMAEQTAAFASQRFHTKPSNKVHSGQQDRHRTAFAKQAQKSVPAKPEVPAGANIVTQLLQKAAPDPVAALDNSVAPDEQCDALFRAADETMAHSRAKEEANDIHTALCLCNRALTYYQQALTVKGTNQETVAFAKMKQNSCVMRSRTLHKRITSLSRQDSNKSDLMDDGQISLDSNCSNISSDMEYNNYNSGGNHFNSQHYSGTNANKHGPTKSVSGIGACARKLRKQAGKGMQSAHSNPDISDATLYESDSDQKNSLFGTLPRKNKLKNHETHDGRVQLQGYQGNTTDIQRKTDSYQNSNTQMTMGQIMQDELRQKQGLLSQIPKSSSTPADLYASNQYTKDQRNQVPYTSSSYNVVTANPGSISSNREIYNQKDRSHYAAENSVQKPQSISQYNKMPPPPLPKKESLNSQIRLSKSNGYQEPIYDYLPCQKPSGDHSRQSSSDSNRTLTPSEHSRDSSTASTVSYNVNHGQHTSKDLSNGSSVSRAGTYGYQRPMTADRWGSSAPSHPKPQDHMTSNLQDAQKQQLAMFTSKQMNRPEIQTAPSKPIKGILKNTNHDEQKKAPVYVPPPSLPNTGPAAAPPGVNGENRCSPEIIPPTISSVPSHRPTSHIKPQTPTKPKPPPPPRQDTLRQQSQGQNIEKTRTYVKNIIAGFNQRQSDDVVDMQPKVDAICDLKPTNYTGLQSFNPNDKTTGVLNQNKIKPAGSFSNLTECGNEYSKEDVAETNRIQGLRPRTKSESSLVARKSALVKNRDKNRPRKSVTFTENICLIDAMDDEPVENIDYVALVEKLSKNKPKAAASPVPRRANFGSGYNSDCDSSDSEETEYDPNAVHCSLCRKKAVNLNEIYCQDCSAYMSKFQPKVS